MKRLIHNAHFAAPFAAVEEISYYEDRKLDKTQMLRFSTCKFVDEGHHIILKGASGNGKTYIACALGNAACRRFKKVRYVRMPELLDELSIARSGGELKKCLKQAVLDNVVPNEREPLMKLLEKKAAEMGLERQK